MGVHGEGPNAIHWATPAYLQRVRAAFEAEHEKRKKEMGNRPFFIGEDPVKTLLRRIKKEEEEQKEAEARAAEDRSDVVTDVYSLIRINRK